MNINLRIYTVNCPQELVSQMQQIAESICETTAVVWLNSALLTEEMRGCSIIFNGECNASVTAMAADTQIILISEKYSTSLLKHGFVDVLTLPLDLKHFAASFLNMICREKWRRQLEIRENMLKTYFMLSDDMLWSKDLDDLHIDINHVVMELSGKFREQIEGKHEREIYGLSPDDPGCSKSDCYVRETGNTIRSEESMPGADGKLHRLHVVKAPWYDGQGRIIGSIGIAKDATNLINQQTKFTCFLNSLDIGIAITDNSGKILQTNKAYLNIGELTEAQVLGHNMREVNQRIFHKVDSWENDDFTTVSPCGKKNIWHAEYFVMEDYWEQQIGFSHIYKNVTSEREHTLQIKKMAIHDPLTGLANRAGMYEYFDKLDQTACAAFMFIDIDNFKYANDRFGHIAGDKLLKDSAELFQKVLGNSYIVRLGGDEFFVILDNSFSLSEIRKMVGQTDKRHQVPGRLPGRNHVARISFYRDPAPFPLMQRCGCSDSTV